MIDITTNIKIAVAGCGSAGRQNIRAFLNIDEVEISACCDTEEEIARVTAAEFGIADFYTDVKKMLDEKSFDALVVAVPDNEHLPVAIEALSRGVHVFCENPLASDYPQAVELARAARESELTAMVNSSVLYSPLVSSVLKYIKEGHLGRIKFFEASIMQNKLETGILDDPYEEKRLLWRLSSAAGSGGAISELGYNLYNVASEICGMPKEVSSAIYNISGFDSIEEYQELDLTSGDTFVCSVTFGDDIAGLIKGSWMSSGPYEQFTLSIHGEEAAIILDTVASENSFTVYNNGHRETINAESIAERNLHEVFVSAIKGECSPVSDFDHALKIQHFIEQSRLSAEGGLKLEFD
ncbi:MAG: Gfo/Idh/MocA family oxidoreductase [Spirochaetales bacterium]|nr:Gfo/Idh/MocA family oxidoreductase [Spirochaetales bacterium]